MENPRLLKTPFCLTGIKNNIPDDMAQVPSNNPELASIEGGFPAITMQPKKAGGLPPHGGDFNGIFNIFSQHIFFLSQGGRYKFDEIFADAIDGYSLGTILQGDGADTNEYISTINNNKINFNTTPSSIGNEWVKYTTDVDELKRLFISYENSVPATKQPSEIIYAPIYGLMKWDTVGARYIPDGIYPRMDSFVGIPFPYPLANAPEGWITMAGQVINPTTSPKLASLYSSNLPDLRGLVIRGWDNGRGLDPSRALGSWTSYQDDAMAQILGSFQSRRFQDAIGGVVPTPSGNGLFKMIEKNGPSYVPFSPSTGLVATDTMYFDNSFATKTAIENRMKNLAFNYITPLG